MSVIVRSRLARCAIAGLTAVVLLAGLHTPAAASSVVVFAAASLREALDEQARRFEADTGNRIVVSYAGSNALAKQIEAGAPANLFVSADEAWMDDLEEAKLLVPGSRMNLLR